MMVFVVMYLGIRLFVMTYKLVIGVFFPALNSWLGGSNYYYRLIDLISKNSSDYRFVVFIENNDSYYIDLLKSFDNVNLVYVKSTKQSLFSLLTAIFIGVDLNASFLAKKYNIDAFYTNARFFGWRFTPLTISWIPDLQHLFLPKFFSRFTIIKRNLGFRLQAIFSTSLVFSSNDSKTSFERFFNISVPCFVIRFSVNDFVVNNEEVCKTICNYSLNEKYIFLPNQYWPHKNHIKVLEVLKYIRDNGLKSLQIVSTGFNSSKSFEIVSNYIIENNIPESSFKFLGVIPSKDLINLMAGSQFVLNPSFFEGWSTTVEEAKSLKKRLLLSDLLIHREQADGYNAVFFDPNSVEQLSNILDSAFHEIIFFDDSKTIYLNQRNIRFFNEFEFLINSVCNTKRINL